MVQFFFYSFFIKECCLYTCKTTEDRFACFVGESLMWTATYIENNKYIHFTEGYQILLESFSLKRQKNLELLQKKITSDKLDSSIGDTEGADPGSLCPGGRGAAVDTKHLSFLLPASSCCVVFSFLSRTQHSVCNKALPGATQIRAVSF